MPKFLNRKTFTVVLVLALIWLGRAAWGLHAQRVAIKVQVDDLETKLAHVENENKFLSNSSEYFKSDEYLEKQARTKLNYKLPDEYVAFIYPDKSIKTASASADNSGWSLPDWKAWLKLFKRD